MVYIPGWEGEWRCHYYLAVHLSINDMESSLSSHEDFHLPGALSSHNGESV